MKRFFVEANAYNTDMKTKPLQDIALKSFSPSSSSVSYTGKADGTTELTRLFYFIGDKTKLRIKTGVTEDEMGEKIV